MFALPSLSRNFVLLLALLAAGFTLVQCSGKGKKEVSSEKEGLTSEQKKKVDASLRRVIFQGEKASNVDGLKTTVRSSGSVVYHLLVRTDDPEALKEADLPVNSVSGDVATARWTAEQVRTAARLASVRFIEPAGEGQSFQ